MNNKYSDVEKKIVDILAKEDLNSLEMIGILESLKLHVYMAQLMTAIDIKKMMGEEK